VWASGRWRRISCRLGMWEEVSFKPVEGFEDENLSLHEQVGQTYLLQFNF